MLDIIGIAKNGCFKALPNAEELYTNWLIECDGKFVRGRFSRVGKPKTDKQLATHFGLCVEKIRQAMIKKKIRVCKVVPNKKMIHEILSMSCGGVGPLGEMKRLSQMTRDEACDFFDNIRTWAEGPPLDCYIPAPDPNWRHKE
jgi:hypothetical protein